MSWQDDTIDTWQKAMDFLDLDDNVDATTAFIGVVNRLREIEERITRLPIIE